jgi:hypothetical protein
VLTTREGRRHGSNHFTLSFAILATTGQFVRNEIEQSEGPVGINRDHVLVELNSRLDVRINVG